MSIDADGRLVFVNTMFGCLATLSERANFKPLWRPPFLSALVPEDRCHLNGLAMRGGRPAYVTVVSRSDVVDGWRDKRRENFSLDELRLLDMLQPAFVTALARAQRRNQRNEVLLNTLSQRLTPREQDTARLVMLGLTDKEIARNLQISSTTVRTHLENAFRKVGVSNRAALVHKLRI
jgi:DNA-binding CsgD family transcriptional regulator